MGLKADPHFQMTLRRGDRVSPGGGRDEDQPKERVGRRRWHSSRTASGHFFPAADPLLAFF